MEATSVSWCTQEITTPGLYIYLIKENTELPETFETSRRKSLGNAAQQARDKEAQKRAVLQLAYLQYMSNRWTSVVHFTYVHLVTRHLSEGDRTGTIANDPPT